MGFIPPDMPPVNPELIQPGDHCEWPGVGQFRYIGPGFVDEGGPGWGSRYEILRHADGVKINHYALVPTTLFPAKFSKLVI